MYFSLFTQPGCKRVGIGSDDKFACKEAKATALDPHSCISKQIIIIITASENLSAHTHICCCKKSEKSCFSRLGRPASDVSHPSLPGSARIFSYELRH